MKIRVSVGPEIMVISRCGFKSAPIKIDDRYITKNSEIVLNTYKEQVHDIAKEYLTLKREYRYQMWRKLEEQVDIYLEEIKKPDVNKSLHFDGPVGLISFKPWKEAKYEEWFYFSLKEYNMLKKKYKKGIV